MKKLLTLAILIFSGAVLFTGCGDNGYDLTAKDKAAFKDASTEMKQAWENGLKADKANDYLTASTNYRALLGMTLTPEQLVAVQTALGGLNFRINDAAAKGDASAQKALEAMKANAPRR